MATGEDDARERARAEAEEQAWRDIVDHYGEQPDPGLVELTAPQPEPERPAAYLEDEEPFTPPPLPPPARISPERRAACVGLVAPVVLLVVLHLLGYSLPGLFSTALVVVFIGSFVYLVATMAPRDPDDDGARL